MSRKKSELGLASAWVPLMYMANLYRPKALAYRIRYAITNIQRDYVVNEGAFRICFEMEDEAEVIRAILKRGLRNPKLRIALEQSHLINLTHWLGRFPDLAEAYATTSEQIPEHK